MARSKIVLPTVINKDVWFYEEHKEVLEQHLGKPYVSYSTLNSYYEYQEDLIKKKILGIELEPGVYADFGTWVGTSIETGEWQKNDHNFIGAENLDIQDRMEGAEYEKFIIIDMGEYIVIGFIDVYLPTEDGDIVIDVKTGKKGAQNKYIKPEYIQIILYAHALELAGRNVTQASIWYIERVGSHVNPPLGIGESQLMVDLEYSPERVKYAMDRLDEGTRAISEVYKTYLKLTA
jgi:hypothetical protein